MVKDLLQTVIKGRKVLIAGGKEVYPRDFKSGDRVLANGKVLREIVGVDRYRGVNGVMIPVTDAGDDCFVVVKSVGVIGDA